MKTYESVRNGVKMTKIKLLMPEFSLNKMYPHHERLMSKSNWKRNL